MKKKRFLKEFGSRLAFLAAALALLLFIPAGLTIHAPLRTFLIVCIVILLLSGAVLLYFGAKYNASGKKVHYILYDHRRKKQLSKNALDEQLVIDAADRYIREFTDDPFSLLSQLQRPLRDQLELEKAFQPLIAYRVLYLISQAPQGDILPLFLGADARAISYFCRAISECGDAELAEYIYRLKKNAERESGRIPLFFKKNERRFCARALRFVEQNFDRFYVDSTRFL